MFGSDPSLLFGKVTLIPPKPQTLNKCDNAASTTSRPLSSRPSPVGAEGVKIIVVVLLVVVLLCVCVCVCVCVCEREREREK